MVVLDWSAQGIASEQCQCKREPALMRSAAVQALTDSQGVLDDNCREQLLIIAQLGAIGSGDLAGATQIKEQFGEQVPVSPYRYAIRGFLLAWADQGRGTGPAQRQVVVARVRPQAVTRDGAPWWRLG